MTSADLEMSVDSGRFPPGCKVITGRRGSSKVGTTGSDRGGCGAGVMRIVVEEPGALTGGSTVSSDLVCSGGGGTGVRSVRKPSFSDPGNLGDGFGNAEG